MNATTETLVAPEVETTTTTQKTNHIILYNDPVNTFDHVINCLQKYCGHTLEQAEQCATLVHYSKKCSIKEGTRKALKPICDALTENHLDARIE